MSAKISMPTPKTVAAQVVKAPSQEELLESAVCELATANGVDDTYTDALAQALIPLPLLSQLHMEYFELSDFTNFWFNVVDVKYNDGEDSFTFNARLSCCVAEGLANPSAPRGSETGESLPHMNLYCKPKFPSSFFSEREQEVLKEHSNWYAENKSAAYKDMPKIFFEPKAEGGCIRFDLKPYWSPKHGRVMLNLSGLWLENMAVSGNGFSAPGENLVERPAPRAVGVAKDWSQFVAFVDEQIKPASANNLG